MSKENVEVVREAWTVFREQGTAGSVEYYAEDCVVEGLSDAPEPDAYVRLRTP